MFCSAAKAGSDRAAASVAPKTRLRFIFCFFIFKFLGESDQGSFVIRIAADAGLVAAVGCRAESVRIALAVGVRC